MKDTALLAVSFGTSYEETRKKTIEEIEKTLAQEFPQADLRRAFTSGMILRRLRERDGIHIDSVDEALKKIYEDGYQTLLVQPTHIINGDEFEKMISQLAPYREKFKNVYVGRPLLTSSKDYEDTVRIVMGENKDLKNDEALVLMGHGTGHFADAAYAALDYRFKAMGHLNVFVGTVEGYPELDDIIPAIRRFSPSKIRLMPFMIVAGDHAINDMAGDDEDSWKNILTGEGFSTECALKGLGEMKGIRQIYAEHLKKALCTD